MTRIPSLPQSSVRYVFSAVGHERVLTFSSLENCFALIRQLDRQGNFKITIERKE